MYWARQIMWQAVGPCIRVLNEKDSGEIRYKTGVKPAEDRDGW